MTTESVRERWSVADVNRWMFTAPAVVLIAVFVLYPVAYSVWLSFQVGYGYDTHFGGFSNLVRMFNDAMFYSALTNTFIIFLVQVPIMLLLALALAACLNSPDQRFRRLLQILIFLPCVTSLVAYSVVFKSMFGLEGVINKILLFIHLIDEPIYWLSDPFYARIVIIIALIWRWSGYNMIFYLSALQNIDKSIYEAARVDGVPSFWRFVFLTVPMLKPVILFTAVMSTIGTMQLFDEVVNIVAGPSTRTLGFYIYEQIFVYMPSYGYATTISYVVMVLMVILSLIQFRVAREKQ